MGGPVVVREDFRMGHSPPLAPPLIWYIVFVWFVDLFSVLFSISYTPQLNNDDWPPLICIIKLIARQRTRKTII